MLKLAPLLAVVVANQGRFLHHQNKVNDFLSRAPHKLLNKARMFPSHSVQRVGVGGSGEIESPLKVSPVQHGGDPTGVRDSTQAINAAIAQCVNQSVASPNGVFPGTISFGNGKSIRDMGGCVVDLEGGEYRISSTIKIPEYTANMQFRTGSIVAGPDFPKDDFLVQVGVDNDECRRIPQGSCNIDINFNEIFFDGSNRASALQINNVMGVTVGPGGYFLNFTGYGMQINNGHEVMMDRCWLGETNFDYNFQKRGVDPNATAIQINGNDHYILNTIVFSSKIGLEINGAADYVTGVHVWFPINQALHWKDTMAFHITRGGNRFNGCYADGGRVVFEGKGLSKNMWTNGFECCAGAGLSQVPHGIILRDAKSNGGAIGPVVLSQGLQIFSNEFGGGSIYYEDAQGKAITDKLKITGVRIVDNAFPSHGRGTRATATQSVSSGTARAVFDFCDTLLFPTIASIKHSLHATAEQKDFVQAQAFATGCTVTVLLSSATFDGMITVDVDSSSYDATFV